MTHVQMLVRTSSKYCSFNPFVGPRKLLTWEDCMVQVKVQYGSIIWAVLEMNLTLQIVLQLLVECSDRPWDVVTTKMYPFTVDCSNITFQQVQHLSDMDKIIRGLEEFILLMIILKVCLTKHLSIMYITKQLEVQFYNFVCSAKSFLL